MSTPYCGRTHGGVRHWYRGLNVPCETLQEQHPAPNHPLRPYTVAMTIVTTSLPLPSCPQVFSLQDLAGDILTVMRLRLKRFLNFLETSPRASRGLLASLDADTCQWVRSARDTEAAARGGAGAQGGGVQSEREAGEPLRSTHGVLLCLARALPRESRHKVCVGVVVD